MRAIQSDRQRANPISPDLVYLIINVIVVLLTTLAVWTLVRLIRRRPLDRRASCNLSRLIAMLVWGSVIPLGILLGFRALQEGSWSVILLLTTGALRWAITMRSLSLPSGAPFRAAEPSQRNVLPMSSVFTSAIPGGRSTILRHYMIWSKT